MTKRQGKRKGKGKDTCDAFSLHSLLSLFGLGRRTKKKRKKKEKSEEKRRAILVSV